MGPGTIAVRVRAIEADGRFGPYYRGDRTWSPGWQEALVDDELLALISSDRWLEVMPVDEYAQAAARLTAHEERDRAAKKIEDEIARLRALSPSSPELVGVEVTLLEVDGTDQRLGTYIRGDRVWIPGTQNALLTEKQVAQLIGDRWLRVRRLQPHEQQEIERLAQAQIDAQIAALEPEARRLREAADQHLEQAVKDRALLARKPPGAPPPATFTDQLLAGMPSDVANAIREASAKAAAAATAAAAQATEPKPAAEAGKGKGRR